MKPFFLTILSLLLLAACSQPTPAPGTQIALTVQRPADTPTPVNTPTRTASPPYTPPFTRRPTLTPYSSSTPSPIPTATATTQPPATPAGPPTTYQLKPWTEADTQAAVAEAKAYEYLIEETPSWTGIYGDWQNSHDYTHLLLEEFLIRFPHSINWFSTAGQLMSYEFDPRIANSRVNDILPQLLEHILNIEGVPLNALKTYLSVHYDFYADLYPANHAFGGPESGVLLTIDAGWGGVIAEDNILLLVETQPNQYHVQFLKSTFGGYTRFIILPVEDNNSNGISELTLITYHGASGYPVGCALQLSVLEWRLNNDSFVNLVEEFLPAGNCDDMWHFETDTDGKPTLIEQRRYETGSNCPLMVYRITYTWNGQQYTWSKQEIEPPQPDISQLCAIEWAAEANETSQEAIAILENGLANWPAAMNTLWGPASADYFRLKLGIWQDLRGQSEIASQLLQSVRDQPVAPEYTLISNLAATYLAFRQQYGLASACYAINNEFDSTEAFFDGLGFDLEWLLTNWGFVSQNWWLDLPDSLCNEQTALQMEVATLQPTMNEQTMVEWLNQLGIPWLVVQETDLNNDGLQDWLLLSDTIASYRSWDLWAFVQETTGYNLVWINEVYTDSRPDTILHQAIQYNSLNINAVAIEENLFIFTLFPEVSGRPVKKLLPFSWELEAGTITNLEFLANSPLPALLVSGTEHNGQYNWSEESGIFILAGSNQPEAINQVRQLIFQEGNYGEAIVQIQELLTQEIQLPSYLSPTEAAVEKASIQARLGYLLGLCYELLGDNEQAIATYWQVWQQFPNDIHTLIIRRKLVALTP